MTLANSQVHKKKMDITAGVPDQMFETDFDDTDDPADVCVSVNLKTELDIHSKPAVKLYKGDNKDVTFRI